MKALTNQQRSMNPWVLGRASATPTYEELKVILKTILYCRQLVKDTVPRGAQQEFGSAVQRNCAGRISRTASTMRSSTAGSTICGCPNESRALSELRTS